MRHAKALLICTLAAAVLAPEPGAARSLSIPGLVAAPLRMMFGRPHFGHRARHHRGHASRTNRSKPAQANDRVARTAPVAPSSPSVPAAAAAFWPAAYGDLVEPILWQGESDRFWGHGYGDILDGVFQQTGNANEDERCAGKAADAASRAAAASTQRVESALRLTAEQKQKLDRLRDALARAYGRVQATCSADVSTPPKRLRLIADRMLDMRQALLMIHAPLEDFYGSLDDAQKGHLDGAKAQPRATQASTAEANDRAPLCGAPPAASAWPSEQIDRTLQPTQEQRIALEALRQMSAKMAQYLAATCPPAAAANPVARLDAESGRLNALFYAVAIMNRPLGAFYDTLSDSQKARLRALRSGGKTAAAGE
jgi:hypothetical protein